MANLLNDKLIIKPLSDKITIVDNLLSEHVVGYLRLRMELTNQFHDIYKDYQAINYYPGEDLITDILEKEISNKFNLKNFQRAWSFIYNNNTRGVDFHADPSNINVNIWLTPEESIEDFSQNGLLICNIAKGPIILEENDALTLETNDTTNITAVCSILEISREDQNG